MAGGASILMRAALDTLAAHERTVWVADSFRGSLSHSPEARITSWTST